MQTNGAGCGESTDSEYDDDDDSDSEGKTSGRRKQVQYFLNGVQVCRRAFQRMLGVGCSRMNRTRARFQGQDERKLQGHGSFARPASATTSVESFMQKLYYSVSESMPTLWHRFCIISFFFSSLSKSGPLYVGERVVHVDLGDLKAFTIAFSVWSRLLSNSMDLSDDGARVKLLNELMDDALAGTTSRICRALQPSKMAVRELPPGNWAQIYLLYQSFCLANDLECAGRTTFYRATTEWRKALKFRPHSKHSLCHICDREKSKMRHSSDFLQHAAAADSLLGHLKQTWGVQKSLLGCSRTIAIPSGHPLSDIRRLRQEQTCIAKVATRQDANTSPPPRGRNYGNQAGFQNRTHISVSAILAHGYGCIVYLSEEGNVAGGTFSFLAILISFFPTWSDVWAFKPCLGKKNSVWCFFTCLFSRLGMFAPLHWELQARRPPCGTTISEDIVVSTRQYSKRAEE